CADAPHAHVCVTNRGPPVRPWGRDTLRVTHPSGASAPASAPPSGHPYTSDRYSAVSRPGWPNVPDTPPPSTHRLTRTSCRSTLRLHLLPPCDKELIALGS